MLHSFLSTPSGLTAYAQPADRVSPSEKTKQKVCFTYAKQTYTVLPYNYQVQTYDNPEAYTNKPQTNATPYYFVYTKARLSNKHLYTIAPAGALSFPVGILP